MEETPASCKLWLPARLCRAALRFFATRSLAIATKSSQMRDVVPLRERVARFTLLLLAARCCDPVVADGGLLHAGSYQVRLQRVRLVHYRPPPSIHTYILSYPIREPVTPCDPGNFSQCRFTKSHLEQSLWVIHRINTNLEHVTK